MSIRFVIHGLALLFAGTVFAAPEELCFSAPFLQGDLTVRMKLEGAKVSGTFAVHNSDASDAVDGIKTYEFTGTRAGNTLKVKFADGKLPDVAPSEMKSLEWKLGAKEEVLRIKFRGKNYETGKQEDYVTEFETCDPD